MKLGEHISVYSTLTSPPALLENPATKKKESIKADGAVNFAFSPSDNYIAYWTPEIGERPARVTVISLPDRREVASKNLFQVKDVKIIWQKNGDKLCVYVERWNKSKKNFYTQFLLFHLRNKLVPCDVLEIKEKVEHFAWEPVRNKFAVIEGSGTGRMDCCIYDFVDTKVSDLPAPTYLLHRLLLRAT
jgi:translation initiation factor 3 subunit B